ncbi:hypothetical protein [Morococcus cerebrosus]|nr:hypothetical protein [Morococcus cerebrosus]
MPPFFKRVTLPPRLFSDDVSLQPRRCRHCAGSQAVSVIAPL